VSELAGRRKRPWWAGTGSIAGTVGVLMGAMSPLLVNAAGSEPSRHPTARVLAIIFSVPVVVLLIVNVVGLYRHPEWRLAVDAGGKWDKAAVPAAVITAVVATALWLVTRSGWPFLIFAVVGIVLLQIGQPSKHRIQ
jgi:hypothetical protein